jgi:hypothetical protein
MYSEDDDEETWLHVDQVAVQTAWEWKTFISDAATLLGIENLDGNEKTDGYSLDYAYHAFYDGYTVEEYVATVKVRRAKL